MRWQELSKKIDFLLLGILAVILPLNYFEPLKTYWGTAILIFVAYLATLPIVWSAIKAILNKKISVDLLAGVALVFSLLAHEWASAIFINLMLTSSRIFMNYNEKRARKNIEKLLKLKPKKIKIKRRDGNVVEINTKDVKAGDSVIVDLGERIPVDGVVISGEGSVNESSITGESLPVAKTKNDRVISSTLVVSGNLEVKAEKVGSETTLEKIIKLVEQAQIDKPDIHTTAEKFAGWYLFFVFLGSMIALIANVNMYLILAIILVVCADDVAVAVPLAFLTAISYAAKNGVIIKGASFLEALHQTKVIFVDKTGTLTKGKLKVEKFVCSLDCKKEILDYVASLSMLSDHPIAKAIIKYVGKKTFDKSASNFQEKSGKGVMGSFGKDVLVFGRMSFLEENGIKISEKEKNAVSEEENKGYNTTVISFNKKFAGFFVIADEIKPGIKKNIEDLKKLGVEKVIMLTGDNEKVAKRISEEVGITDYYFNLLPEQKLDFIRKNLNKKYKTAMIGDGINDAAALSLADIGIAMGTSGYDVTIESADIIIMKDNFSKITDLIRLSKYVMKISRQDFIIWGISNILGLGLVFGGILKPDGAAAYNFLTDFFPLGNSTRIFGLYIKKTRN